MEWRKLLTAMRSPSFQSLMPPLYSLGFDFAECFESLGGTDAMKSGRSGERQRDG